MGHCPTRLESGRRGQCAVSGGRAGLQCPARPSAVRTAAHLRPLAVAWQRDNGRREHGHRARGSIAPQWRQLGGRAATRRGGRGARDPGRGHRVFGNRFRLVLHPAVRIAAQRVGADLRRHRSRDRRRQGLRLPRHAHRDGGDRRVRRDLDVRRPRHHARAGLAAGNRTALRSDGFRRLSARPADGARRGLRAVLRHVQGAAAPTPQHAHGGRWRADGVDPV